MSIIFPKPIVNLPELDISLEGVKGFLSQGKNHQIVFIKFEKQVELPEHSHEDQWEVVLEGKADVWIDGVKHTFEKGDRFFISKGIRHSAMVYKGYASIIFFNEKNRYKQKYD